MSDPRQQVKDMVRKALDERTPEKERITTGFKALALIQKHGLLDSPLDALVDTETRDLIDSVDKTVRGARKLFDKFQARRGARRTYGGR